MPIYSDINLSFAKHPFTDDVVVRTDVDAVKNALYNLILCRKYDKPFDPDFGTDIRGLLFENFDPLLNIYYETKITETITEYEPRVVLERVKVVDSPDMNAVECIIEFYVIGINSGKQTLTLDFERIR